MNNPLLTIKLLHTLIWAVLASATLLVFYAGVFNHINVYTWISIGMVIVEGIILVLFRWSCPLTVIARKYSDSTKDNFDIFLPNWLAKHNKTIFTTLFLVGLVLVVCRVVFK